MVSGQGGSRATRNGATPCAASSKHEVRGCLRELNTSDLLLTTRASASSRWVPLHLLQPSVRETKNS